MTQFSWSSPAVTTNICYTIADIHNSHCTSLGTLELNLSKQSQSQNYVTTDGQSASVSWNIAPIWGLRPDFCYCQTLAGLLMRSALSLTRDNCSWPSSAQSFSGPTPVGLVTIIYSLRFATSLFVASHDSQGYGGGIRLRLHTGDWSKPVRVRVRVTLQLTVSQSICLGVEPRLGLWFPFNTHKSFAFYWRKRFSVTVINPRHGPLTENTSLASKGMSYCCHAH
jgi:hypothetical protein